MHLEVLIEESSAEPVVRRIVEATVGWSSFEVRIFEGKPDLLESIEERLRGYLKWRVDLRVLVLVDRDDEDCVSLKTRLESAALRAGLLTRATATATAAVGGDRYAVCNRVAIEELESWFFGDEPAVRAEYPRVKPFAMKAAYRDPDAIVGGTWEAMERLLKSSGYYPSGLRKADLATRLAPRLDFAHNRSASFHAFVSGLKDLVAQ